MGGKGEGGRKTGIKTVVGMTTRTLTNRLGDFHSSPTRDPRGRHHSRTPSLDKTRHSRRRGVGVS